VTDWGSASDDAVEYEVDEDEAVESVDDTELAMSRKCRRARVNGFS